MVEATSGRRGALFVAIFCVFFFFYGLGAFGLVGADEPRYAQVAREMLAHNDWVTPTLNGQAWLEKPPLYYWGAMISYWLLGVRDWAARVPSAVLGTAMVFAVFFFLQKFRKTAALSGALMVCSSVAVFAYARGASTDMPLAAAFTIAMLAWFTWRATAEKRWLAVFYFFLALGTLAKGPVAVGLAALIIFGFVAWRREGKLISGTLWIPGIVLFLAVALPWYVLAQIRNPQFFNEFIVQQNFERFGTNLYRHHYPWWYYAPVLVLGLFPWTVMAFTGFGDAFGYARGRKSEATAGQEWLTELRVFLLLWAVIPVIFFSISESKLPGYILPAIPAWILLGALYVARASELSAPMPGWLITIHSLWLALVIGGVVLGPRVMLHPHEAIPANVLRTAAIVLVLVLIFSAITLRIAGWELVRLATLLPMILAVAFVLKVAAPVIDETESARPVAAQLQTMAPGAKIAVNHVHRAIEYGLGFYRNQMIFSYERGEVPRRTHVLVTPMDYAGALPPGDGKRMRIGIYGPQRLEFWWMGASSF